MKTSVLDGQDSAGLAQVCAAQGPAARHLADKPVMISVDDPDGYLGPSPRVLLHRPGRVPAILKRSLIVKNAGRFLGWMPDDLDSIALVASPAKDGGKAVRQPTVTIRTLSIAEAVLRVLIRWPHSARTLLRLLAARNVKGATFRFLRHFEALSSPRYQDWLRLRNEVDKPPAIDSRSGPLVLVCITGAGEGRTITRKSLERQSYRAFEFAELEDLADRLSNRTEDKDLFWLLVPAGVTLSPWALQWMADCLIQNPQAAGVYCDEDQTTRKGEPAVPLFKPAWNLPLVQIGWLPMDCVLLRHARLPQPVDVTNFDANQLVIQAAAAGDILHLPRVLVHRSSARPALTPSRPLLQPGSSRPPVTVIIPTRDRADLLSACLDGLLGRTDHGELDIIVIDNDSKEDATRILLDRIEAEGHVRRLPMPGTFNFSRACNLGVDQARHDRILLLNNDVEPLERDWLGEMNAELDDPQVGAVGALLLYPDGFVQHAGVTLGAGSIARHSFHFHDPDGGEDHGLLAQRRHVSAVTAACLLTRKSHWLQVGGMDEANLPVAFNDVDYCLKLRRAGLDIVWTPHARLVHRESVSRGRDDTVEKRLRFAGEEKVMFERWAEVIDNDPCYNPNCSLSAGDFVLEAAPRDLSARSGRIR
ncbi:glycosyltransferase [Agrobacterium vitis]|uniref:glycosyltransferase family 2 protein n=1 Tax=Agrobacterium vitis TaxID=373 RepID=UPI0012E913E2|nr:glycosyltransferase family 2 protein [Agrobacterium vitis]MVA21441.1 glycosyltransferase [Agrobacterium vitis]